MVRARRRPSCWRRQWPSVRGPPAALAQNEPVYPVYDGFTVTEDGLYVVAFAYFSHNFEPVTVAPGPRNRFEPDAADRGQPTTFLPGHHRFQCIMVLGPDFAGGLRWTLDHAGVDHRHQRRHAAVQLGASRSARWAA